MASSKRAKNDLKAKQKRQKIIAGVGGVILLAILAIQVPSMMKRFNQKPPPLPGNVLPPNGNPPGTTTPLTAPTLAGTGTHAAGATPAVAAEKGPDSALAVYEVAPQPQSGQLGSFGRFVSKDPFVQQVSDQAVAAGAAGGASSGSGGSSDGGSSSPGSPTPVPTSPSSTTSLPASSATISVNGATAETVAVGADFPASDPSPPFHLLSATTTSARVTIAGGSYADGRAALTLHVGKAVTLVNTADGTRYTLLLVAPK